MLCSLVGAEKIIGALVAQALTTQVKTGGIFLDMGFISLYLFLRVLETNLVL